MKPLLVALLDLLRKVDFTSIIVGAARGLGGPIGWIISLFARPIVQGAENALDQEILKEETAAKSDAAIDAAAADHTTQIAKAETDDDFDQAARDSLHKH